MNRQQEKNHQAAETTMIAGRRQNIRRMKEAFRKHGRKQRHVFIQTISPWALFWVSVWMMEIKTLSLSADLWRTHGHKSLNRKTSTTIKTTEETSGASKHQERAPEEESNSSSFLHMKLLLLLLHGATAVRLPPAHRQLQAVISLWWTCCPNLWPQLISYTSARFIHRTDYRFYTLLSAVITKCHRPHKKTNVKIQGGQEAGMCEVLADSYRAKTQGGALQCNGKESPPAGSYQDFAFKYLTFF